VELDVGVIRSALANILENAIDACRMDTAKAKHFITLSVRQSAEHLYFEVKDDGIGMDEKTLQSLFRKVYSTKGKQGTGLGLFMSGRILAQQGGEIRVDSSPGIGSIFTIQMSKVPVRLRDPQESEGV
jgi:signal transduction histidine kinase